jgi:hypothetical protein
MVLNPDGAPALEQHRRSRSPLFRQHSCEFVFIRGYLFGLRSGLFFTGERR